MNWQANRTQTEKAIHLAKNASAPGMDGCTYELWKKLRDEYEEVTKKNTPGFNIHQENLKILFFTFFTFL